MILSMTAWAAFVSSISLTSASAVVFAVLSAPAAVLTSDLVTLSAFATSSAALIALSNFSAASNTFCKKEIMCPLNKAADQEEIDRIVAENAARENEAVEEENDN